ncbi:MAG: 30S ribosomal protein S11 [Verrucomicrobia bacterium A1]|nr:MAG: 30S ribosomal protein S11 [Verrucomicrobia bacterium A1]
MADEKETPKTPAAPAAPADAAAAAPVEGAAPAAEAAGKVRKSRLKGGKLIPTGIVHIRATFNNTSVTITDPRGAVISWSSAGRCAFKGSRKSTAYAATVVAQEAARTAIANSGMREVEIFVQGPGSGRESAIRAIQSAGLAVTAIRDVTPIPHNGCRPPKRRRV